MPLTVDINEAKGKLPALLERVIQGEEVIIARDGAPVARWVPVGSKLKPRTPGSAKGMVTISPDFEAPLPEYILQAFEQ